MDWRIDVNENIVIKKANVNNLKGIDLTLPRNKLIVVTGLSGSGKSSLAFDTIYAEGQRRYVESLSSYARQFLGQMDKPDVEMITGLSPSISIDQKTTTRNPRSTVGTVTEIYDYLRLLFAKVGKAYCPICGKPIEAQTIDQMTDRISNFPEGTRMEILAPIVRGKKGTHAKVLDAVRKDGYLRVRIDGEMHELSEEITLDKNFKHSIDVVVDRLIRRGNILSRLTGSLETALDLAGGIVKVAIPDGETYLFNQNMACPEGHVSIEEISPRMFSFNSPFGMCPECNGLGSHRSVNPALFIPNKALSIDKGGLDPFANSKPTTYYYELIKALAERHGFSTDRPLGEAPKAFLDELYYGTKKPLRFRAISSYSGDKRFNRPFEGIIKLLENRYEYTSSDAMKDKIEQYMTEETCKTCHGARLKPEILSVKISDKNISEVTNLSIHDALTFMAEVNVEGQDKVIAAPILKEIRERLSFLDHVGLGYLTLARKAGTLSGGESQRIRLATQIGSGLTGVIYVLDEPSIGLHQRDNAKLIETLERLRDLGNTVIVVEHDEETMLAADHIVDIGPGAGIHGGEVVAQGTPKEIMEHPTSVTGAYLSGRKQIAIPKVRRTPSGKIVLRGAAENNLKHIDVEIPTGVLTLVTGVSGSGKSSLIDGILYPVLARAVQGAKMLPGKYDAIEGIEAIDKVIEIDQSPIGRTPRSNPATYTGVFDLIRDLFAELPESKMRGYKKGRFSFNVKGGRCEACRGDGILKVEMHFLPDVYVPCEVCKGKRYNRETLEVRYKGKSISDVLEMTVEEATEFFSAIPPIHRKLKTLLEVGLGYLKLGQSSTELSGGEAQRVKLATELSKRATGKTLYILDEPTTGLATDDIARLINVLERLVDGGNTMIIIEHNLDVIKCADHIIDLGPEGGDGGGTIVASGTPEEIAKVKKSYTGQFLKKTLRKK